jgi:hypothetical protein
MKQKKPFPAIAEFLFNSPLYAEYQLADDLKDVEVLCGRVSNFRGSSSKAKVDGYCPFCKKDTTFTVDGISIPSGDPWKSIKSRWAFDQFTITCSREELHQIKYFVHIKSMMIKKVGQLPSLADIAIDENRQKYRKVLQGDNWAEFYKAIGLAAHGEGIGSFVYLRRVFERLIQSRFEQFKDAEGWSDAKFLGLRMDEKIAFLKGFLPPYLVEVRRIYGIFSKGIHELDNDACLDFFEVGKRSIIIVLEDDLKHLEELQTRREMAEAVMKFAPSDSTSSGENSGT